MRRFNVIVTAIIVAVILAAGIAAGYFIGQSGDEPAAVQSPTASVTESPEKAADGPVEKDAPAKQPGGVLGKPVEPETSDRGLIVKDIGEVGGFLRDDDPSDMIAEFTVDSIEVGAECTEDYAEGPQNGHFVVVTITATVHPGFADDPENYGATGMPFDPGTFGLVDADGLTVNDPAPINTYGCFAESALIPSEVGEGQTATGKVVLDSPTEHGVLTYRPWLVDGGWEWEF